MRYTTKSGTIHLSAAALHRTILYYFLPAAFLLTEPRQNISEVLEKKAELKMQTETL